MSLPILRTSPGATSNQTQLWKTFQRCKSPRIQLKKSPALSSPFLLDGCPGERNRHGLGWHCSEGCVGGGKAALTSMFCFDSVCRPSSFTFPYFGQVWEPPQPFPFTDSFELCRFENVFGVLFCTPKSTNSFQNLSPKNRAVPPNCGQRNQQKSQAEWPLTTQIFVKNMFFIFQTRINRQ